METFLRGLSQSRQVGPIRRCDRADDGGNLSSIAPWYVVPANDKKYARLAALKILVDELGRGVALTPRPLDPAIAKEASRLFDVAPYELE